LTTSAPSIAVLAGGLVSLIVPGFGSLAVARAGESALRGSWFRAAYELYFTPLSPDERRSAKSIIDVAVDRAGEAVGGAVARLAVVFVPLVHHPVILAAAMAASVVAIIAASRLNLWHLRNLERSLVRRAAHVDLAWTRDAATAHTLVDLAQRTVQRPTGASSVPGTASSDAYVARLAAGLLDQRQTPGTRVRAARKLGAIGSPRAADALWPALDDPRFDVRTHSLRALKSVLKATGERLDEERVIGLVLREIDRSRPFWAGGRLLPDGAASPIEAFVKRRAADSLDHVFALLSLMRPAEPLKIAARSLRSSDEHLRGTSLEYLDGVLPPAVREQLWPFLAGSAHGRAVGRERALADLVEASGSITLANLGGRTVAGLGPA
jgi:hypothetical protein